MPQEQLAGKRVKGRVRLLDIAPTVLETAGVSIPSQCRDSRWFALRRRIRCRSVGVRAERFFAGGFRVERFGVVARGKVLVYSRSAGGTVRSGGGSGCRSQSRADFQATLAALAAQLEAFDSHFGDLRGKSATEGLSSSEMQKLASLGYVGLQKTASASNAAVTGTDPKDEIATANRVLNALASISEGKPDRAIAVLEQAVAAAPNMYLAQYALGAALAEKQRYAQAIEHLHKAIELRPGSAWAAVRDGSEPGEDGRLQDGRGSS